MSNLKERLAVRRENKALRLAQEKVPVEVLDPLATHIMRQVLAEELPKAMESLEKRLIALIHEQIEGTTVEGPAGAIGPQGPEGIAGPKPVAGVDYPIPQDGQDADESRIVTAVLERIPAPNNGKDGIDGEDGTDGQDAVVDYGKVVRLALKEIKNAKGTSTSEPELDKVLSEWAEKIYKRARAAALRGGGDIVVAGSGISIAHSNGRKTISATGSGILSETPVGTVDGSNLIFTVSHPPLFVIADSSFRVDGQGYSYAVLTITMDALVPPTQFIRSYYAS